MKWNWRYLGILAITFVLSHNSYAIEPKSTASAESNKPASPTSAKSSELIAGQTWNLKNTNITSLIHLVAQQTGKNFVIDPQVKGNVTFIAPHPLPPEELYQVFLTILQANGFVAVANGDIIKIMPAATAKQAGIGELFEKVNSNSKELAVKVVHVKNVSAAEVMRSLQPLVTRSGNIQVYQSSNDIIISDSADNIANLVKVIQQLDAEPNTENSVKLVRLKYANATDLARILEPLVKQSQIKANNTGSSALALAIAADPRSNSILISGGNDAERAQLYNVVERLDAPNNIGNNQTEVIYLKHLRAADTAPVISGIIQNYFQENNIKNAGFGTASTPTNFSSGVNSNTAAVLGYSSGGNSSSGNNPGNSFQLDNTRDLSPKSGSANSYVQWEETTNALIITAPPKLMQNIKKVIGQLDIRRPQVLIEAIIAEVSTDKLNELGINWNMGGKGQFKTQFDISSTMATNGLSLGYFSGSDIRFLLQALASNNESNILATPNVVTLDNEEAQIKVGKKISFAIAQVANQVATNGNPFTSFERQDVGLILNIRPQITPNGEIKLELAQELSNLTTTTASRPGDNPDTTERYIHTTVMVNNGETLVLGGLLQNEWTNDQAKVPVLGDVPVIGNLFKHKKETQTKTNLMIFLRPVILDNNNANVQASNKKYIDMRETQLQMANGAAANNQKYTPATLPTLNKNVDLPQPF